MAKDAVVAAAGATVDAIGSDGGETIEGMIASVFPPKDDTVVGDAGDGQADGQAPQTTDEPGAPDAAHGAAEDDGGEGSGGGQATPEAPAAEEDTVEGTEGKVDEEPKPEPVAVTAPPAPAPKDDKAEAARQQQLEAFNKAYAKHQADYAAMEKKIEEGGYDPIDDGQTWAKLQAAERRYEKMQREALEEQLAAMESERRARTDWERWGDINPDVGTKRGQEIFNEELTTAKREFPGLTDDTYRVLATRELNKRAKLIKAQNDAKKAKGGTTTTAAAMPKPPAKPAATTATTPAAKPAATPAGKGGGRVIPAGASTKPPKPSGENASIHDRAAAGKYGDLSSVLK